MVLWRLYFLREGNQSGLRRSMPTMPSFTAFWQNSSLSQLLKHHWQAEWLILPLRAAADSAASVARVARAIPTPAAVLIMLRRDTCFVIISPPSCWGTPKHLARLARNADPSRVRSG